MKCSRCESERIQRDYDDVFALMRLAGMRKLLCNDCGYVFVGFDPFGKVQRAPAKRTAARVPNRRRSPRFKAHLPAAISLVDRSFDGSMTYSDASQGHCEAINEHGMGLTLVGSRFEENELTRANRLLLVRIRVPESTVEAVVSVRNHRRIGEKKNRRWYLGVQLHFISEVDKVNLNAYLKTREMKEPLPDMD